MVFADIKGANQKHRNEQLNRSIQNFLYGLLATDNDVAAKKSLAVLTELWRRHVWRDARTVNVIGKLAVGAVPSIQLQLCPMWLHCSSSALCGYHVILLPSVTTLGQAHAQSNTTHFLQQPGL